MKITYIHHSSYLVELDHVLLLFDYVGGTLPQMDPDKDLLVFSSHSHGDHFDPLIFDLGKTHPRLRFILSSDIWKKRVPENYLKITTFMKAGDEQTCPVGIKAYKSTDEGVAFVVRADGETIYHAGDLNDWRWEGESDSWNNNMHVNYLRELKQMQADGVKPTAAMVPVDGRLEQWFSLGLLEFMEYVGADSVFPMHFWGNFEIIDRLKRLEDTRGYRDRIADLTHDGQTFEL